MRLPRPAVRTRTSAFAELPARAPCGSPRYGPRSSARTQAQSARKAIEVGTAKLDWKRCKADGPGRDQTARLSQALLLAGGGEVGAHQLVRQLVGVQATPPRLGAKQRVGTLWQVDSSCGHTKDCTTLCCSDHDVRFDHRQGRAVETGCKS